MNKKIITTIIVIVLMVIALWVEGFIPKQIAKIYATRYMNDNFPEMQLEYENIEWNKYYRDYIITFKDKENQKYGCVIGPKYLPISMGQGINSIMETYQEKYQNTNKENLEDKNYQRYSKIIDNVHIGLNIPSEWKYEELQKNPENDFYKFALKLYKNSEEQYAVLYYYNNSFGVCGTGRLSEKITLNNGQEATIGYYDKNTNWNDISFYNYNKYIAFINDGLINDDAKEVIDFIKTINIIENYNEIEVIENI